MVEADRGFRRRPETRLRLEPVQVSPDVFQKHVAQIMREAIPNHYALHYQVLPVGRHPVGRNLPSAVTQAVRQIVRRPIVAAL